MTVTIGAPARGTVHLLVRGTFATRVAEHSGVPGSRITGLEGVPTDLPDATMVAVLHDGRDHELRDGVDALAFGRGVPSVGVELLPRRIVVGPACIPGRTACHDCYRRRIDQHGDGGAAADPSESTRGLREGFAAMHVAIAAGLLGAALDELTYGPLGLGATVRSFDLVTGAVGASPTIAVDGCARCGSRFHDERTAVSGVVGLP